MILITHSIAGVVIAKSQKSFLGALLAALLSHFILDMVPHYDYVDSGFADNPYSSRSWKIFLLIMLDGTLGVVLPLLIFPPQNVYEFVKMFFIIAASMLPDALAGLDVYFPSKLSALIRKFHNFFHFLIAPRPLLQDYPVFGLAAQLAVAGFFVYVSFVVIG